MTELEANIHNYKRSDPCRQCFSCVLWRDIVFKAPLNSNQPCVLWPWRLTFWPHKARYTLAVLTGRCSRASVRTCGKFGDQYRHRVLRYRVEKQTNKQT